MKRAPLVLTGTVAGLAGVLSFHSSPAKVSLGAAGPAATGTSSSGSSSPGSSSPGSSSRGSGSAGKSSSGSGKSSSGSSSSGSSGSSSGPAATGTRSAVGPSVNYYFGVLSVRVTATGSKITKVSIAAINDGGMPRSQYIDQQAIPMLEQEVMRAQSGNIQGVAGASYTSAGFAKSLQGALKSLGLK
ncbi:MAG: FMN-binding protein [Streptosporangiaceae bacterium]